jgi:hypothetical protein
MKQIVVVINPDGSTSLDLQNFHGQGCDQVEADFTEGSKVTTSRKKREWAEPDREESRERSKQ